MGRPLGSKNLTRSAKAAALRAEADRLEALEAAEDHPWILSFYDVAQAMGEAVASEVPAPLEDVQNTLRGVLATLRTVGRESDISAVRVLFGGSEE